MSVLLPSRRGRRWFAGLVLLVVATGAYWWLTVPHYVINEANAKLIKIGQTRAEVEEILGPERTEGGLTQAPDTDRVSFGHTIAYRDGLGCCYSVFMVNDSSFWKRHPQSTGPWRHRHWASPRALVDVIFDNRDRVAEVRVFRWQRQPPTWFDRAFDWMDRR